MSFVTGAAHLPGGSKAVYCREEKGVGSDPNETKFMINTTPVLFYTIVIV